ARLRRRRDRAPAHAARADRRARDVAVEARAPAGAQARQHPAVVRVRGAPLVVVGAALLLVVAPAARADGDPASDTLYVGDVFLPLGTGVSKPVASRLA